MNGRVGVHRTDDAEIIGVLLSELSEKLAGLEPRLAVSFESKRGRQRRARGPLGLQMERQP